MEYLDRLGGGTFCEFKGAASYYDAVVVEGAAAEGGPAVVVPQAAWTYDVTDEKAIEQRVAFYLRAPLVAMVDGELAAPQDGDFYGGWITHDVVGPFKGGVGTRMW